MARALTRRPLSTRQLQQLVTLCNKGVPIAEALSMVDQTGAASLKEALALMNKLLDLLDHLTLRDLCSLAFTTRWQALQERMGEIIGKET